MPGTSFRCHSSIISVSSSPDYRCESYMRFPSGRVCFLCGPVSLSVRASSLSRCPDTCILRFVFNIFDAFCYSICMSTSIRTVCFPCTHDAVVRNNSSSREQRYKFWYGIAGFRGPSTMVRLRSSALDPLTHVFSYLNLGESNMLSYNLSGSDGWLRMNACEFTQLLFLSLPMYESECIS